MTESVPQITMEDLRVAAKERLDAAIRNDEAERRDLGGGRTQDRFRTPAGLDIIRYRDKCGLLVEMDYEADDNSEDSQPERSISVLFLAEKTMPPLVVETSANPEARGKDVEVPSAQHARIAAELIRLIGRDEQAEPPRG